MKIKGKDFEELKDLLNAGKYLIGIDAILVHYKEISEKGHTKKRFIWDLLYGTDRLLRRDWFDKVYTYANDDHINTALKKIVNPWIKELEERTGLYLA